MWECQAEEKDIEEVVLALACPRGSDAFIETMDIVILPKQQLVDIGLTLTPAQHSGNTVIMGLRERHMDIESLDLSKLTRLSLVIADAVRNHPDNFCQRFRKARVSQLVEEARRNGRLAPGTAAGAE